MSSAAPASVPSRRVQQAVAHDDLFAVELERRRPPADRRHRVGHQHRSGLTAQREAEHGRRDMLAVDDHAEPGAGRFESGGDRPGLAQLQRSHRIEEMREARDPLRQRGAGLCIGRHGVAEADANTGLGEPRGKSRRHLLGRQRDHHGANLRSREHLLVLRVRPADHRLVMHPGLAGRQERTFQVDAENARIAGSGKAHRFEPRAHPGRRVGDERRQQARSFRTAGARRRWRQGPRAWARH